MGNITMTWWDYFHLGVLLFFNVDIMMLLKYFIHLSLENLDFYSKVNSPYKKRRLIEQNECQVELTIQLLRAIPVFKMFLLIDTLQQCDFL